MKIQFVTTPKEGKGHVTQGSHVRKPLGWLEQQGREKPWTGAFIVVSVGRNGDAW